MIGSSVVKIKIFLKKLLLIFNYLFVVAILITSFINYNYTGRAAYASACSFNFSNAAGYLLKK